MATVFSPILRKTDFHDDDFLAPESGLLDGPTHCRIEGALSAQRAEAGDDSVLCRTLDEFRAYLAGWTEIIA